MRDKGRSDRWTKKAKSEGYAARSVFKLEEIQRRERVLPKKGMVLDLGCSPGSWSQYVYRNSGKRVHLVGLDIKAVDDYLGTFVHGSVFKVGMDRLLEALGGYATVVLSDMAPNTQGDRFTDHVRQIELASAALRIARGVLRPGGDFVAKVFDGEDAQPYVDSVRQHFHKVRRIRPEVTRRQSVEFFVVGRGFREASRIVSDPDETPS